MLDLFILKMNEWSLKKTFEGNKICTLRDEVKCEIGSKFRLTYNDFSQYYKVIEIWHVPKDFAIKFLWRLEGADSPEELEQVITEIYPDATMLYAHFYKKIDDVGDLYK
jgi:uncharacterized protein YqfB (UPF0267 family)